MEKKTVIYTFLGIFVLIGILPVVAMLLKSVLSKNGIDLSLYLNILSNKHQWTVFFNSFKLSITTTALSIAFGVLSAILFSKTNLPLKRLFTFIFSIPLFIPSYLNAVLWWEIMGKNGLMSKITTPSIAKICSHFYSGFSGSVFLMTITYSPIVMLLTMAYLNSINPSMEEAALLTSSWKRVLLKISIPIVKNGIIFAAMIVFLLSFGEFGIPVFMKYPVFPTESFTYFSAFYNFRLATALSTPVVFIILLVLLIEKKIAKQQTEITEYPNAKKPVINLKRSKIPVFTFILFSALMFYVLPILLLFIKSLPLTNLFHTLSDSLESVKNTITLGLIGAFSATITGFFIGYGISKNIIQKRESGDFFTLFTFAIPSTVSGIGLISLFNNGLTSFIYNSSLIVIAGFTAKYTLISNRITRIGINSIPPSMEEAAEIEGANWLYTLKKIILPLTKKQLMASFLICYVFCAREPELIMLTLPAGKDTLSVRLLNYMANGSESLIASLGIITLLISLVPVIPAMLLLKGEDL